MSTVPQAKGLFIVIEGPDGSGKTTQLNRLNEFLTSQNREVVIAREPGGTKWGQKIREIFLAGQGELDPMTEVMLLLAAKAQVLREIVYPAYNAGKIVLMDRYSDSLMAYQGGGRQLGLERMRRLLQVSELNFPPDLTIYMNTSWSVCSGRILNREISQNNTIDALSADYHKRVHRAYGDIVAYAREHKQPHAVILGDSPPNRVAVDVLEVVHQLIPDLFAVPVKRIHCDVSMRD